MKVTSFILFALLASQILAVKAGVKTLTAAHVYTGQAAAPVANLNAANVAIIKDDGKKTVEKQL